MEARPIIVIISTHTALGTVYERHLQRFSKIIILPEVTEFERNAIRLHAKMLIMEFVTGSSEDVFLSDILRLRKMPIMKSLIIEVFCRSASSAFVSKLHAAGVNDIILTTHQTPRSVAQRLHNLLLL